MTTIINLLYNSEPLAVHAHGLSYSKDPDNQELAFNRIKQGLFSAPAKNIGKIDDLTIVTWSNRQAKTPLEESLERFGVPYLVLGRECAEWKQVYKITTLNEAINGIRTPYILAMDSFDVLVLDDPRKILERFKSDFKCGLLFNSSSYNWPKDFVTTEFEKSVAKPPYQFLNSGCFIGETAYIGKIAAESKAGIDEGCFCADDQIVYRHLYKKYYPEIQIDYRCRIFQSLKRVKVIQRKDVFYVPVFEKMPLFVNLIYSRINKRKI